MNETRKRPRFRFPDPRELFFAWDDEADYVPEPEPEPDTPPTPTPTPTPETRTRVVIVKENPEQTEVLLNPDLPAKAPPEPTKKNPDVLSEATEICDDTKCETAIRRVIYKGKTAEEIVPLVDDILKHELECDACERALEKAAERRQKEGDKDE